ncbi:zinc-dependent alcohol dehydrogenase family protein [Microbacterium invictum]|uniref:Alcohol dehydrogenase n=1 Tax=Microbacterium invictum TaxID=515415 RepID=A0AA40SS11_9MICO|nr:MULTISPECIES: zinc-dependent alcohol dehydrogenase family protein [Microbacterium]MBB4141352.1 alcohol dehydrogenase [Microbacterium invictum]
MRAVVYDAVGELPRVREVPAPLCPPDGAVIRVEATGVCRSDWHAWRGHDPVALPHIPGHEFAGTVAEVGAQVSDWVAGARVTAPFVNGCGTCGFCARGDAQVCPDQTQPGFTHAGSFAEYVVVHAADLNLVNLPDSVDSTTAAALGCRFATAFRAVTVHGDVHHGDEVAVFGCGGVGLSAITIAVALGARVTAVDLSEAALDRARELGAADVISAADPVDAVIRATGGGAHVTIDALGSPATADAAVRSLRRRGRHVQVGLMLGDAATASLPWDRVIAWELSVTGSHGMAAQDYPAMMAMIESGQLAPERLIGAVTDLQGAADALVAMGAATAAAGITVARP